MIRCQLCNRPAIYRLVLVSEIFQLAVPGYSTMCQRHAAFIIRNDNSSPFTSFRHEMERIES